MISSFDLVWGLDLFLRFHFVLFHSFLLHFCFIFRKLTHFLSLPLYIPSSFPVSLPYSFSIHFFSFPLYFVVISSLVPAYSLVRPESASHIPLAAVNIWCVFILIPQHYFSDLFLRFFLALNSQSSPNEGIYCISISAFDGPRPC